MCPLLKAEFDVQLAFNRKSTLVLSLAIVTSVIGTSIPPGLTAQTITATAKTVSAGQGHAYDSPHIKLVNERSRRNLNHIYTFDKSPLGNRVPVILLPGRAEEFQHASWWKRFRDITYKNRDFEDHFKLYAFIYNSANELDVQAKDFSNDLKNYFGELPPERKVVLVSYSLGGVITRDAMEDPDVFDRVHTVIAIGVPFHGSPLFDPEWFTKYLRPRNHSPIRQLWDRFIFRMYLMTKTNLTRGLKWDNFDGSEPQFQVEEELKGDQVVARIVPYEATGTTPAFKQKTIVYASYMDNEYTTPQPSGLTLPKLVGDTSRIPKEIIGAVLPIYGSSVHAVFTYMNHQLSNLPTYDADHSHGKNMHVYKYNDGVIPLSSALFLPPRSTPYAGSIDELTQPIDVQKARVFANIDHMHLGEYSINVQKTDSTDILHPEEGKRTPTYWVLYDLQQLLPKLKPGQNSSHAKGPNQVSVDVPSVQVPSVRVPSVSVPSVQVPAENVPSISVPSVNIPDFSVPSVSVPSENVPSVSVPSVKIP